MKRMMSKKTKGVTASIMAAICIVGGSIVMTACSGIGDVTPPSYGSWENNYVYRGNIRSRTTGTDWSYLVTKIEIGGIDYEVVNCSDYEIVDDDLYMCLSVALSSVDGEETTCLVKYSTLYKTQELIYAERELPTSEASEFDAEEGTETDVVRYGAYNVERIDENGILLSDGAVWYSIDFQGNSIDKDVGDYSAYRRVSDKYMVEERTDVSGRYLYCTAFDWLEPVQVAKLGSASNTTERCTYEYIEKNGAEGFLIETYSAQNGNVLTKLEFFDLKTNEKTLLTTGTTDSLFRWIETPEKEYFLTYRAATVTYKQRTERFGTAKNYTANVNLDCVIRQIEYSALGATLKTVYEFEREKDFSAIAGIANGKAYVFGYWYESAVGCAGNGGSKSGHYVLDLATKELTGITSAQYADSDERCADFNDRQSGIICDSYVYYIQKIELNEGNAYRLKRYDETSGETEVMQLWRQEGLSQGKDVKFCEAMWFSNGGSELDALSKFIVRAD